MPRRERTSRNLDPTLHRLDLGVKLTIRNLERALKSRKSSARQTDPLESSAPELHVDLTRVEWVDPAAAVRLVLLCEAAVLKGLRVTVKLPLTSQTDREQQLLQSPITSLSPELKERARHLARALERRNRASEVLARMRFTAALKAEHLKQAPGTLNIEAGPSQSVHQRGTSHNLHAPAESYFRILYPLQWIPDPRTKDGRASLGHLAQLEILADVIDHPSGRVSAADSQTLAHVFLKELVENTVDHASRRFALIAAWIRPNSISIKKDEILDVEKQFAKWCADHPLIEVVVGDSGSGIPVSLREAYVQRQPRCPAGFEELSDDKKIILWSLDKWSTRSPEFEKRGTRGLYRVERIVRKYDGLLTIRTGSSFLAVDCGSALPPQRAFEKTVRTWMPGTVVHVRLPVMLADRLPQRLVQTPLTVIEPELVDLGTLEWDDPVNSLATALRKIRLAIERATAKSSAPAVLVDLAFASLERRTFENLLRDCINLAHPVAIVLANIESPGWDAICEVANSIREESQRWVQAREEHDYSPDAVLIQHADGRLLWAGASIKAQEYLESLLEIADISAETISEKVPHMEERSALLRNLAEAYHIISRAADGNISLHIAPETLRNILSEALRARIDSELRRRRADMVVGSYYVTPSLERVSLFLNVEEFLRTVGYDQALGMLAQKVAAKLATVGISGNIEVLADLRTSQNVLETFRKKLKLAACLQPTDTVHVSQIGPSELPVLPTNSHVLLFSDLSLSGESVASLLASAIRADHTPLAHVAVLDAREEPDSPVRALGRSIPTISGTPVKLKAPDATSLSFSTISPITYQPESDSEDSSGYYFPETHFSNLVRQAGALYFAHIGRHSGQHFTLYVDTLRLLGGLDTADPLNTSEVGDEILGSFKKTIDAWLGTDRVDLVAFPLGASGTEKSPAEVLAKKLAFHYATDVAAILPSLGALTGSLALEGNRRVRNDARPVSGDPGQLPLFRALGSASELPDAGSPLGPRNIVIVDYGTLTGKSVQGALRYATEAGASRALAVVLISQLPPSDERFLGQIRKLTPYSSPEGQGCDLTVVFLARYPLRTYDPLQCPPCLQLRRLKDEERFYPPELLQQYINASRERLRARPLSEFRSQPFNPTESNGEGSEDLGATCDPEHVARYRLLLHDAQRSTKKRMSLWDDLERLQSADLTTGSALSECLAIVRLLAAEWTLLKREPLTYTRFKRALASISVRVIHNADLRTTVREDAIVVLRTSSKEAFAASYFDLFSVLVKDERLVSQLLYCAFTYLHRDYLHPEILRPLTEQLERCSTFLANKFTELDLSNAVPVSETLFRLSHYGTYLLRRHADLTMSQAWSMLSHEFGREYHVHHPVCAAFGALFFGPLEADTTERDQLLPNIGWRTLRDAWEEWCVPFLMKTVLPLFAPLRSVFEGLDTHIKVGTVNAEAFARLARGTDLDAVSTLSQLLLLFANEPLSVRDSTYWLRFTESRDLLGHLLLEPGEFTSSGTRERGSTLVRFLRDCPADLSGILTRLRGEYSVDSVLDLQVDVSSDTEAIQIFCHTEVAYQCLAELLRNVSKHCQPDTSAGATRIPVDLRVSEASDSVLVSLLNGGVLKTRPSQRKGIGTVAQRLKAYGATFSKLRHLPSGRIYGIEIQFSKG